MAELLYLHISEQVFLLGYNCCVAFQSQVYIRIRCGTCEVDVIFYFFATCNDDFGSYWAGVLHPVESRRGGSAPTANNKRDRWNAVFL